MATFTAYSSASTPDDLATALLAANSGIQLLSPVTLHASSFDAVNFYDGSLASSLGIGAGLLLTSGYAPGTSNTIGWDGQDNSGVSGFYNGDADIDAVVNTVFQTQSYDATTFEFDFSASDPNATSISFDLVFGSEEYPEWVDAFVDCAVVIVNGQNYALFNHDPKAPLSVISPNLAAGYFQDNAAGLLSIQYDGVSQVLKIVAPINGNGAINHIKIGIADTGDHILDSGLFIANMTAGNIPGSGVVSNPGGGTTGDDTVVGSAKNEYFDLQSGNDVAYAGAGDDIVVAGAGNDTVYGGSGADDIEGDAGNDYLDGGADIDTAVFTGNKADYALNVSGTTVQVVSAAEGSDTLVNIEQFKFKDGLFALVGGTLVAVDTNPPGGPNSAGSVVISGVAMAGKTLTAIVIDADGVPTDSGAITYQWQTSTDGNTWTNTGVTTSKFDLADNAAGLQVKVAVAYSDATGTPESPVSAAVTVAQTSADIVIAPMLITAPAGASVQDPLTTLVQDATGLGYTPAEASQIIKQVLGIDPAVDLAHYDALAALAADATDAAALSFLKIAAQVAMAASVSDPSGMNLTLAVLNASAANATLDLTSAADLTSAGLDAGSLALVQGLNLDMADAPDFDTAKKVWNDWAGQADNLKPFLDHIEVISVHINQAPTGVATAEFQTLQDTALTIANADLVAGFSDADGGILAAAGLQVDQGGSIALNADGSWTFTPDPGFAGPVELSWSVGDGQGGVATAATLLIVQPVVPPVDHPATGSLSVSGVAEEGGSLLALANVTDPDGLIGTSFQWQENIGTADAPVWQAIAGATGATLAIADDQSDVGKVVRVVATTTDALGGTTDFVSEARTIANVNDPHTGTVSISGTAQDGQTLTASNTLADADGMGAVAYQWRAAGVDIQGATGSALTLTAAEVGKAITVFASYTDAFGTFESETSAATAAVVARDLNLQGTSGADTLTGDSGNDTLSGLAGQDSLYGLAGNDILDGGAGRDLLDGGEGSDLYLVHQSKEHGRAEFRDTGMTGVDEVRFSATKASTLKIYAADTGIERVVLGTGTGAVADTTGTTALNVDASAAANGLVIIGNAGANTLTGGQHGDRLEGGAGADKLLGGAGADVLAGGTGKDLLTGGGGADLFVFDTAPNASTNVDTLTDFTHLTDKLGFSMAVFDGLGTTGTADEFWAAAGANTAHDATDRLIYNTSTGALYYDADGTGDIAAIQVALVGTGKAHPTVDWTDIQLIA
ncbi:choice-of-anchor L domain-containing protein [Thauera sp. 2A1]|uniref:choice-of-anchor L domain-containing protein n=1 Tax=Thauera sp. 2A1 TaxID=2570191 RepID=UPI0012920443|nr:choice-of-anchor L domain-containing protein [Thauera sp. 2A1]KAI5912865.1 choice-of-anchor L domain-containing protein [Thauera sp. 2A1]